MAELKHVKGLADLQRILDSVPPGVERNILRGALRAGCTQELLPEVQANVVAAGAIKAGEYITGLKVGTRARGGTVTAYVKSSGKHGFIAHWLEYGVRPHTITARGKGWLSFGGIFAKSVEHPGIRPRPHFRPALDRAGVPAIVAAAEYMKRRFTKESINASYVKVEGDE